MRGGGKDFLLFVENVYDEFIVDAANDDGNCNTTRISGVSVVLNNDLGLLT